MTQDTTKINSQAGFIALVSAIVISALLVLITISLSYSGFFVRANVLDTEFKKESLGFAEACVDVARIKIANTNGLQINPPGSALPVDLNDNPADGNECTIVSINGTAPYTIKAQTEYKHSFTNILATVSRTANNVTVETWKEVANF
jgi:hypothetical protein